MSTTRLSRHVRAPRADVYRALLDADAVRRWMVPDGMTSEVHEFAAHEGGRFRISLTYDEPTTTGKTTAQTDTFHGRFVRLVPDTEVVQAVEFETDDPQMQGGPCPRQDRRQRLGHARGGHRRAVSARAVSAGPGLWPARGRPPAPPGTPWR